MGKRGPERKAGLPYRPQLRLSAGKRAQAEAIGVEELSRLVEWALPVWMARREGEAPRPEFDRGTVILRPQPQQGAEPASIWYDEGLRALCCRRPVRDRRFWELMKVRGLSWADARSRYERTLTILTGAPIDRVAELADVAYRAGWPVALGDMGLAERVLAGAWVPEQRRWVQALKSGDFLLTWEQGSDEVYAATKHLPEARWDKGLQGTVVAHRRGADVRDFAAQWDFALTEVALRLSENVPQETPRELLGLKLADAPAQPRRARREKAQLLADQGEVSVPAHLRLED